MSKAKRNGGHHVRFTLEEQKRNYRKRVERLCLTVAGPGVYQMIPKKDLHRMFVIRALPFEIYPAPGQNIPDDVLRKMRKIYLSLSRHENVCVTESGIEIPLSEFLTTGLNLKFYIDGLRDSDYPDAAAVKEALAPFTSFEEGFDKADELFDLLLNVLGFETSYLDSYLYWTRFAPSLRREGGFAVENHIYVYCRKREEMKVKIGGMNRTVFRVRIALSGSKENILDVRIPGEKLGPAGARKNMFGIYIQQHALMRLMERLAPLDRISIEDHVCTSLLKPVVLRQGDGSYLIEMRVSNIKAGYLLAEIIGDILVVKTFLFITNGGTPEGRRLQQIAGLERPDREYLAIDRLSTFARADIRDDKNLEALFTKAGCGCLFALHDEVKRRTDLEEDLSVMQMLTKYFGIREKHDFMVPDILERWQIKSVTGSER